MPSVIPSNAYLIIVGAMKAGTSTLFRLLSQHPGICPACIKEPEFFSQGRGRDPGVNTYEDLYRFDPDVHARCLEASTGYSKFPVRLDTPRRMKEYGIDPLFIYSVRNPLDRIESQYNFAILKNKRWASDDILSLGAVHFSMYYLQMREYLKYFPDKSRYFIVDFNSIVSEPAVLAKSIFKWSGLPDHEIAVPEPRNVTPDYSSIETRLQDQSIEWSRYVPDRWRQHAARVLRRYGPSAKRRLTRQQTEWLSESLIQDARRFGETFDFDTEKWGL